MKNIICACLVLLVVFWEIPVLNAAEDSGGCDWVRIANFVQNAPDVTYGDWSNCHGVPNGPDDVSQVQNWLISKNDRYMVYEIAGSGYYGLDCIPDCPRVSDGSTPYPLCLAARCGGYIGGPPTDDGYCRFLDSRMVFEWKCEPGCLIEISDFFSPGVSTSPVVGETVSFSGDINGSGSDINWIISVGGVTLEGTGFQVQAEWVPEEPGPYTAQLHAWVDINGNGGKDPGECEDFGNPLTIRVDISPLGAEPGLGRCDSCPCGNVPADSSFNITSGNLYEEYQASPDLKLPIILSYNSRSERNGRFGYGWQSSVEYRLLINPDNSVVALYPDGREEFFDFSGSSYTPPTGVYDQLAANGTGYVLTRKDGTAIYFDDTGRITRIEDKNSNQTIYAYDGDTLVSLTDPDGRVLLFTSDENNRVTAITDTSNRSFTFAYDADGNLISITDSLGSTRTFSYDADHNLISKSDAAGNTVVYTYDAEDRVLTGTDSEGSVYTAEYLSATQTRFTGPGGSATTYAYNSDLNITTETDAQGNVTSYTYDANQNLATVTDSTGTVSYTYDNDGNRLSRTDQQGNTTVFTYDADGNVLSATGPDGNTTTYTYDANGNLLTTTDPAGGVTQFAYDSRGRIISATDASGHTTIFAYDAPGNIVSIADPSGTTTMTYDASGNMVSMTDAAGHTSTFEYDVMGNMVKMIDPQGNVTLFTYDVNSNRVSITDANGNTTRYEYDYKDRVVKIIDALAQITTLAYSESGCSSCGGGGSSDRPASVIDANGNTTGFLYDSLGRLVRETDPLGRATSYTYDATGNIASRTDANGNTITYSHDPLSRLISKNYPDGTYDSFTYDVSGNMLTAANEHISYSMAYDRLGRLVSVADSGGRTIQYRYDAVGNRTGMITPDGSETRYLYDEDTGRLKAVSSSAGVFEFSYDGLGRRSGLAYANGVATGYRYDSAGRLTAIRALADNDDIVSAFSYTHDRVGNRLTKAEAAKVLSSAYDAVYQLLVAVSSTPGNSAGSNGKGQGIRHAVRNQEESYSYDPVGNRLSGPDRHDIYSFDPGNQLVEDRHDLYVYDKNGNMVSRTGDEGTTTYGYDYENRLVRVENPDGTLVTFKYDPFGRRIEKSVDEKITRYFYDNEDILFEYDGSGKIGNRYVHGPGIDEPLALEQGGKRYFYHADGLGSIVSLTDMDGRVVQTYEYDSFGNLHDHKNRIRQPYTYTAREWDRETALYFYRARYYDPTMGRFISRDPIGLNGGMNVFAYVQNNPVNWIDPTGEAVFWYHFYDGYQAGRIMGKGRMDSLNLGWATMKPDFSELKNLPEAHATSSNPRYSPDEATNNSLSMARSQWALGTTEGQGIAIHIWRDVVSHKGSYFPVAASISDYIKHIIKFDLLTGGTFSDVIGSRLNNGIDPCK